MIEPAPRIAEVDKAIIRPSRGVAQIARISSHFEQRHRGMRHVGVIVENGGTAGMFAIPRMVHAVMIRYPRGDGCKGVFRGLEPRGLLEHYRDLGERGDGESIPVGNDLFIAP